MARRATEDIRAHSFVPASVFFFSRFQLRNDDNSYRQVTIYLLSSVVQGSKWCARTPYHCTASTCHPNEGRRRNSAVLDRVLTLATAAFFPSEMSKKRRNNIFLSSTHCTLSLTNHSFLSVNALYSRQRFPLQPLSATAALSNTRLKQPKDSLEL